MAHILKVRDKDGKFVNIPAIVGARGEKGEKGDQGEKGADGKDGTNGYTPIKGTDYFTESDKAEFIQSVIAALPIYNGEVVDE